MIYHMLKHMLRIVAKQLLANATAILYLLALINKYIKFEQINII